MRSLGVLLLAVLAGCSLRFSGVSECAADADCAKVRADLVCDTAASVCVEKGCRASADCASAGGGLVCDPVRKVCAVKSCTSHEECAPFGDNYACRAGKCLDACFPATFSAPAGTRSVKLGAVLPLSADVRGSENAAVRVRRWSIELALKEVNEVHGGIQIGPVESRRLDLTFCDTASDPLLAGRLAQYLVAQGRIALLTAGTAETQQVLPVTRPKNVLVMSVSATANVLTVADGTLVDNGGLFFRTVPRDEYQAKAIVAELKRRASGTTQPIGVVHENDDYGNGLSRVLNDAWSTGRIIDVVFDPASAANLPLDDLDGTRPAYVMVAAKPSNTADVLRQFQTHANLASGRTVPLLTDASTNQTIVDQLGDAAGALRGAIGTIIWVDTDGAAFQAYKTNYQFLRNSPKGGGGFAAFEKDGTFGPHAYDATYLLAYATGAAIAKVGEAGADQLTGQQLAQGISMLNHPESTPRLTGSTDFTTTLSDLANSRSVNLAGTSGTLDFDTNGDVPGSYGLCRFDGSPVAFDLKNCSPLP